MGNVSGVTGAGAVWREAMEAWAELAHPGADLAVRPLAAATQSLRRVDVCALSGMAPGSACPRITSELLRTADPPLLRCDWHERSASGAVRGALASGLPRLGDRRWAARRDRNGIASRPTGRPGRRIARVQSPADGDAFVLSPSCRAAFQSLELSARCRAEPAEVTWLLDGVARPKSRRRTRCAGSWSGEHTVAVASAGQRSRPVAFVVYGAEQGGQVQRRRSARVTSSCRERPAGVGRRR